MLIKCVFIKGSDLPIEARTAYENDDVDYSYLIIGNTYEVYGLMFLPNRIDVLISITENPSETKRALPDWVPLNLFEVVDNQLPKHWCINTLPADPDFQLLFKSFNIQALISYPELANSYKHYVGMIEREEEDLELFVRANNIEIYTPTILQKLIEGKMNKS